MGRFRVQRPLGAAGGECIPVDATGYRTSLEAAAIQVNDPSEALSAISPKMATFRTAPPSSQKKEWPLSSLAGAIMDGTIETQTAAVPMLSSSIPRIAAWNSTELISRFE